MKEFVARNLIRIAIGVICILIILSVSLSLYNGNIMRRALVLKEQSNFGLREVERVYQNIQLMDISSRGYALIRQPEYLFWTVKMARDRNTEIFRHLDSIFVAQNFTNPDRYEEVKKGLTMKDFTITNAMDRIKREGDIFKPVLGKGIDLEKILKNI